jgi:multidrug efflux pump subunit AcrB
LAIRQCLVLLRRAQQLRDGPGSDPIAQGVSGAARELAPAVVGTALVTAAVLGAPVVMGDIPGLEVLHPFAVTVLAGLVSSMVVVLLLVPVFLTGLDDRSARRRPAPDPADPEPDVQVGRGVQG